MASSASATIDLASLSEQGRWSGYQKLVLALCSLAIVLDGFDTQAIGFAAPALLAEWGITKAQLAPVLAVGLIGMTAGGALGGALGDRFGTKAALTGSVLLFGAATAAMSLAESLFQLGMLRLIAGFGLGGALPNAAASVAEFTPAARRSLAVTLSIVCVPVGGVLGGLISASILEEVSWRGLFAVAGGLPMAASILLFVLLPDSPFFLYRRGDAKRLRKIAARMGISVPTDASFVHSSAGIASDRGYGALFAKDMRADTLAVWGAFFACLFCVYMCYNWIPLMLADAGLSLAATSVGLLAFNVGSVLAAIAAAAVVMRAGSRSPMLVLAAGGALGAVLLAISPLSADSSMVWLVAVMAFEGGCIAGLQVVLYALAAHVFPVNIRATGIGSAAGVGRLGAVFSTMAGAAVLSLAGADSFFLIVGVAMIAAGVCIALVSRHLPRPSV